MDRAGGLRLTKFVSNSKELLMSIPQTDKQQDVPDKKLLETILDNKRALGVLWNTEDNKLRFQVHMKEKPLTRRETRSSISWIFTPFGLAAPFIMRGKG